MLAAAGSALLLFAACQTGPFSRDVTEERVFAAGPEAVFEETQALLEARGYRIRLANAASGRIEALSLVRTDAGFRQAMQRRIRVVVTEEGPSQTRLAMTVTVLEESEMPVHGQATFERPLRETWFYEDFFDQLAARMEK